MTLGIGVWCTVSHVARLPAASSGSQLVPAAERLEEEEGGKQGPAGDQGPARGLHTNESEQYKVKESKSKAFKWSYCQRRKGAAAGVGVCTGGSRESISEGRRQLK